VALCAALVAWSLIRRTHADEDAQVPPAPPALPDAETARELSAA
jgi:hypothetical protein